jgi:drug/metabolite transporter (DMT)-like permease
MWLLFLLLHLVGSVGYNLVLRKSLVAKADKWTLATIMQTAIAIPMAFALFIAPPDLAAYDVLAVLQILATTGLVIALHIANVQALQSLEAGVFAILYNLRIIFTTVLGILFLNEDIVPLQILGGIFIFLAVLTVKQKGRKKTTHRGIEWGLAASVIISVLNLFEKDLINDIGFLGYMVPVTLLAAAFMWTVLIARGQRVRLAYLRETKTINLMVLRAMSAYGFTLAFNAGGLLSVSNYISSLGVIVTILLGAWLLQERDYMGRKLAATGLAVIGLTCILIVNLNR